MSALDSTTTPASPAVTAPTGPEAATPAGAAARHGVLLVVAAANLLRFRARSLALLTCLLAVLVPLLTALAITAALVDQGQAQLNAGADILVSGDTYGRGGPVPLSLVEPIAAIDGVQRVQPRIVSRVFRGGRMYTLLAVDPPGGPDAQAPGVASDAAPDQAPLIIEGRAPAPGRNEAVVGAATAQALGTYPGSSVMVHTDRVRLLKVVGMFNAAAPLATANMIWTSFAAGARLYEPNREATELALYTRPGYAGAVVELLAQRYPRLRVQPRSLIREFLERGYTLRAGSFGMLWLMVLAVLIPVLTVASGFGLHERRREVALCRAMGWHVGELLEVRLLEDLVLSTAGTLLAGLVSWAWVRLAGGVGVASIFVPGIGLTTEVPVPATFTPGPLVMVWVVSTTVVLAGTLVATWSAAAANPATVLR